MRREVIETVTPGAAFDDELLEPARNNFLCAVVAVPGLGAGAGAGSGCRSGRLTRVAGCDLSTGELRLPRSAVGCERRSCAARPP